MKPLPQKYTSTTAIILYLMTGKILIHLFLPEYGYHRDEMYYMSIGDQFTFSNLDMLPLSPLYLRMFTLVLGHSLKVVHLASSLLGAFSLLFTCLMTKELGGNKYAVFVTGIFFLFSGFIIFGTIFTYDSIDFLVVIVTLYLLVKIFKTNNQKLWLPVGIVLGLGLMNKLTILFYGFAIFVTLWLVPHRKMFKSKQIWIAGVVALLFLTPYMIWQSRNDWYFLDFASTYAGGLSYLASLPEFIWNQIFPFNIFLLPVWLTGLSLLLFSRQWKQYRYFGIMYVVLFILYYKTGAKFYFFLPMYSILIAVGSIKLEEKLTGLKTRIAIPVAYFALTLPFLPLWVPILPVDQFIAYGKVFGVDAGVKYENLTLNQLPQHFADRFGWEELVQQISAEYHALPREERAKTGILTNNWGIGSAVHFYKDKYDLPEPTSNSGWYYFQTIQTNQFKTNYICVGFPARTLRQLFNFEEEKRVFTHPYCMPHENNRSIHVCKNPKVNLAQYFRVEEKIDPVFLSIMRREGPQKAIEYYREQKAVNPNVLLFTEDQINGIGYYYLGNNQIEEAIIIFNFNVEVFPESFNVYDSLGEAYMKNGNTELAILNYEKSLELYPKNENAKTMLKQLRKN